ncbi:hypothetical protein [Kibdelosporangium phytohabitans]|uniref:hypothetical protein n=1 Tax=Kibdelosporangium phytohabitans TaxID=860235 RepID=UPI0012F87DA5|nr:hypothetical protein [Kibdelosporangium phytohabitans]MBE1462286.1 hypothetical protein [Kibdelosporangium phytohabitans]
MTQPRPMSTPIFDELLREFTSRMDELRATQPDEAEPAAVTSAQSAPAAQAPHRHRAE